MSCDTLDTVGTLIMLGNLVDGPTMNIPIEDTSYLYGRRVSVPFIGNTVPRKRNRYSPTIQVSSIFNGRGLNCESRKRGYHKKGASTLTRGKRLVGEPKCDDETPSQMILRACYVLEVRRQRDMALR